MFRVTPYFRIKYFQITKLPATAPGMLVVALISLSAQPAYAYTIYVSNEKDNTISIVDGNTLEVTETVPVGERPRGIVLSHDGKVLYMCTSDEDHVEVLDLSTLKVTHSLPSGPDPELMQLNPEGTKLYIANEDDNLVTVVNVEERSKEVEIPVGIEPEGIGVSPDGKWLVNTSETTNMAHFINTETLKIEANVLVDTRPRVAQFTADGAEVWVSSEIGGTVSIIDTESKEIKHKMSFEVRGLAPESIQPVGIKLSSDGSNRAYIALGPAARVAVVDMETYEVEKYLLVGQRVWNLEFSPEQDRLFTTNGVSGDISIVDLKKLRVI